MRARPLPDGRVPVLLSAHDESLISDDARAILRFLDRFGAREDPTADVAATLLRLRRVRRHRAVVRAADRAELVAGLSALQRGDEHPLVTRSPRSGPPTVAFVFAGQGNHWPAMGTEAYQRLAGYRAEADRCAQAFAAAGLPSPLSYLCGDADRDWPRIQIQGAQFVHAVSLAQQWQLYGMRPDTTIGHSLGEIAAAYVAQKISLADAVGLVAARVKVVDRLTGRYGMAVLGVGHDEARTLVDEAPGWLEVSAVNGPSSTVVSGDYDAVVALTRLTQQRGTFTHLLTVDYPGHTSALRGPSADLTKWMPTSSFQDGPVAFIGSATGTEVTGDIDFSQYWHESLCGTVRFDRAVRTAQKLGADTFIEMSAHPALLYPLTESVDDESTVIVGSGHRDQSITDTLSANLAAVATADSGYRWAETVPAVAGPPLRGFPNAPMRAVHLWVSPERPATTLQHTANPPTVAIEDWQAAPVPVATDGIRCAIAIVGDTAGAVARRLSDAILEHPGCELAPLRAAEVVAVIAPTLDQHDVADAVEAIAGRPDAGLPDYAAIVGPRCRTVWLLTVDGENVRPGDAAVKPAHTALAAMHRSIGFEFGEQSFGTLDVVSGFDAHTASAAVGVFLGEAGVMALRLHDGQLRCYVRGLRKVVETATQSVLDNVVITGGSGAIALRYAQYCVERGARRVVLLSRSGLDDATLQKLVGQHCVEVFAPRCDITDRVAVAAVAAEFAGDGASMLIHTAGIATLRLHAQLTGADVADVSAAKVAGLAVMADVWPLQPECRILACSSVFGVWGGHGHAAYAAANRLLDVLAGQLRSKGLDCIAIRWGLWQDAGIVEEAEIARTERSGLIAMRPELAMDAGMGRYGGDPLIFDADFDRLRVFFESQGLAIPLNGSAGNGHESPHNRAGPRPLADVVHAELAATLHLNDSISMDPTASLVDLGLDSLLALDLRKRLRRAVGRSAPVAQLLGGITISQLIDVLGTGTVNGHDSGKVGIHA